MDKLIEVIGEGYVIVTLACVIVGYLITTTPYLERVKASVPVIVTLLGVGLGLAIHGLSVDVAVYGALAGIISTGLYELFGKGIKGLGNYIENRKGSNMGGDE